MFGTIQGIIDRRNEIVRDGLDKVEGFCEFIRKKVNVLTDEAYKLIEKKIGTKAAEIFRVSVIIAPMAIALFAAYSALSLPGLIVTGLAFTAVAILTKEKIITNNAKNYILASGIPAAVLATVVKVVSLLAAGSGILPIAGTLLLGAAVTGALYLLINRNYPTYLPKEL